MHEPNYHNESQLYDHQAMDSLKNGTRRFQFFAWDPPYFIMIPGESHIPSDPEHTIDTVKNWSTENRPMIRGFCQRSATLKCMFHLNSANRFFFSGCNIPSAYKNTMQLVIYDETNRQKSGVRVVS